MMAIYQLPGSNAVQTADRVRQQLAELTQRFPADISSAVSLDTTQAVRQGLRDIVVTLLIAIGLVAIVVFIFLQDLRATLIPLAAVPVSLIGTFALFPLLGFSINTLSLFGLVLAIGLVVDDAIVVVEAVQRHIDEGMTPHDAAIKAMDEVSGPVIAIALILASVFVPTAFIPGISGRLFQQFALTIAASVLLSAFNALTLSPALAARVLRPRSESRGPIGRLFGGFNRGFAATTSGYIRVSGLLIRRSALALLFLALVAVERIPGRAASAIDVPAAGRSRLCVCRAATAERRVAAALRRGGPKDRGDPEADAGSAGAIRRCWASTC